MTTTTSTPESRSPARPHLSALLRRWPTLLAVAMAVIAADGAIDGLAPALMLLPTAYVLALAAGAQRWTWPIVVAVVALFVGWRALDLDPRAALVVIAGAGLGAAVLRGRDRRELWWQGAGLVGFGAASFATLLVAPQAAVWLVAAAWFLHGVWDFVHLYRDAVVARSFAEWCGVIDVLTAAMIVLTATSWVA